MITDEEIESMTREELMEAMLKLMRDPNFKWWRDESDV